MIVLHFLLVHCNHLKNYFDIYMHNGLVGSRSLLGHAIHLNSYERDQMSETETVAVHCPTSNLFLGSGLFDLVDFKRRGIRTAIASDTGGGTSHGMLQTLADAYKIQQYSPHQANEQRRDRRKLEHKKNLYSRNNDNEQRRDPRNREQ